MAAIGKTKATNGTRGSKGTGALDTRRADPPSTRLVLILADRYQSRIDSLLSGAGILDRRLIHHDRKGDSKCHTLRSEEKILATWSFTTKTMARANRLS